MVNRTIVPRGFRASEYYANSSLDLIRSKPQVLLLSVSYATTPPERWTSAAVRSATVVFPPLFQAEQFTDAMAG
jgi:hypothetical protein